MTTGVFRALACGVAILLLTGAAGARQAAAPQQQRQQQPGDKPQADMAAKCKAMMAQHEKMMADQKAADQRLDGLVAKMNSASGQTKVDATAAVVSEMVAQRKTMHEAMMKMHHGTMGHMLEHMQAGKESMAMCPMMKEMGTQKH